MRASVLALAFLAYVVAPRPLQAQARQSSQRVAVIDSHMLLDSMPGRSGAEVELGKEQSRVHRLIQEASDSLRVSVEHFSRSEAQLSPRMREAAMMQLRARELALEEMVSQLDAGASRRLDELRAPLLQRIREAVRAVRLREGFTVVLDIATTAGIVDADPSVDLTARVLAELRSRAHGADR